MARLPRIVIPGIPHHVTQRGARRMTTFFNDDDYQHYKDLLSEHCRAAKVEVWAYCLMPNHVHLVLVPETADGLREVLGETHRRYTRRINFRNRWRGHLWQERFHSFAMDEKYLRSCVRYVELNPVRARMVRRAEDWIWSSAGAHLSAVGDGLVDPAAMLSRVEDWPAYLSGADKEERVEALRKASRTGRPLGSKAFIKAMEIETGLELMLKKPGRKPKEADG